MTRTTVWSFAIVLASCSKGDGGTTTAKVAEGSAAHAPAPAPAPPASLTADRATLERLWQGQCGRERDPRAKDEFLAWQAAHAQKDEAYRRAFDADTQLAQRRFEIEACLGTATGQAPELAAKGTAEQTAIAWLEALGRSDGAQLASLTALPFHKAGPLLSECKPAATAAELAAFVTCVEDEMLVAKLLRDVALSKPGQVTEVKGAGTDAYKAFVTTHAKDAAGLPASTRVLVAAAVGDERIELLLAVVDGKVTGAVFGAHTTPLE